MSYLQVSPPSLQQTSEMSDCLSRLRRVKCDEKKPHCERCTAGNRRCGGYDHLRTPAKSTKPLKITLYVPDVLSANSNLVKLLGDEQEKLALNHFYLWTERCFPSKLILPFQQPRIFHEPAIRHAMVAIGVLQERNNWISQNGATRRLAAMEHYGKALHMSRSREPETIGGMIPISLLTCVLFVCLETLHGRHSSALSHLQSGYKLFHEAKRNKTLNDTTYASESTFRSLFVRLSCQITDFNTKNCEQLSGSSTSVSDDPIDFANLNDARDCFTKILEQIANKLQMWTILNNFPNLSSHSSPETSERFYLSLMQDLQDVDQWILAFNFFLSHCVSALHTCDSYVLTICSFFLKLRLTMLCRDLARGGVFNEIDFASVLGLGGVLYDEYESFLRFRKTSTNAATCIAPELICPLHRLFNKTSGEEDPESAVDPRRNGVGLFFFLGAFCSLVVASMCSQDSTVRHKAHDVVSQVCRCGRGWDTSFTVQIGRSISRNADATEWYGSMLCETASVVDSPLLGSVISPEMGTVLALVQSFNGL